MVSWYKWNQINYFAFFEFVLTDVNDRHILVYLGIFYCRKKLIKEFVFFDQKQHCSHFSHRIHRTGPPVNFSCMDFRKQRPHHWSAYQKSNENGKERWHKCIILGRWLCSRLNRYWWVNKYFWRKTKIHRAIISCYQYLFI